MPYRHSVWIDVFGVLALLVLLLGPLAYLAYLAPEMMGGGGPGGGDGVVVGGSSQGSPPLATRGLSSRSGGATPVPGLSRSGASPPGGDAAVPFSDEWRSRAVPDLSGPASSSASGVSGDGAVGAAGSSRGAGSRAGTPRFAAPEATGGRREDLAIGGGRGAGDLFGQGAPAGFGGPVAGGKESGRGWTGEAQEAARKGRKLVGEIGRLTRSSGYGVTAEQSSSDPGSPNDPSRRDPGSPSNVPIDDHLHWLLAAGVLWGVWRLGRG